MIPFVLAAVGGYLLGDSMGSEKFEDGGLIGKRVKLIEMKETKKRVFLGIDGKPISHPIKPGDIGTIVYETWNKKNVKWDNGRNFPLIQGVDKYEIIMEDGGSVGVDYQIKKPNGTYYWLSMPTGRPAWSQSADIGYRYTKEQADKLVSILEKEGITGLSIVKYDKDWWKNQPNEFAKGGKVKKIYAVLRSPMGEIIADIEVENEDKMEALKKFREMGINEVGTISFMNTQPNYY